MSAYTPYDDQTDSEHTTDQTRVDGGSQAQISLICNVCQRPINASAEHHRYRCAGEPVHGSCVEEWL